MMNLLRSHRWFPVLLVGLTALLTVWLDQISRWDTSRRTLNPDKPEYVAEQLTATRFTPQGLVLEKLVASRMWQYPAKPDAFFEQPDLYAYQQGQLQYHVFGESGRYNNKTQQAYFDKKVTLVKPADPQRPETRVLSSAMFVDTAKHVARSQAPTAYYYGNSTGHSIGFVYLQDQDQLSLLSTTKIIYAK